MRARTLIRLAAAAAVAVSVVPMRAGAAGCIAFRDAAGDARLGGPIASADRLDIVAGGLHAGDGMFRIDVALRSLAQLPAEDERDHYVVEWRSHGRVYSLEAIASRGGWTFAGTSHDSSAGYAVERSVRGSVDAQRNMISFTVPYGRDLTPGSLMTRLHASTYDARVVQSNGASAETGGVQRDDAGGGDIIAGPGCAQPLNDTGQRCALTSDRAADVAVTPLAAYADRAVDLRGVRAATNDTALVFEIAVAALDEPIPDDAEAQQWTVAWQLGAASYTATATRDRSGSRFWWTAPDGASPEALGVVNATDSTIAVAVPRSALGLRDGAQVTGITVHAADLTEGLVESQSDDAPDDAATAPSYAAGVPCARQSLQLCPVVADLAGDAGPVRTYDGRSLPENQEVLDVLSAGADTTADAIVVSARIADVNADAPAGYETLGYTLSWHRKNGNRFYAEASRTGSVWTFTYGIDASRDDGPSGAVFGGVRTTGSVDAARDVIRISVPRSLIDGSRLPRFGASSWLVVPANTVGAYQTVDTTPMGAYRLGVACGA